MPMTPSVKEERTEHDDEDKPEDVGTEQQSVTDPNIVQEPKAVSRWQDIIFLPFLLFFYLGNNVISTPLTNLLMSRACLDKLNYSSNVCDNLKNFTDVENEVQIIASNITLYSNLISILPSAILAVLAGPWSDKYGRKPLMYLSLVGIMLYDIGVVVYAVEENPPLYDVLFYAMPVGMTGGVVTFLSCTYALAADNTEHIARTRRYGLMQISVGMGSSLGGMLGGAVQDHASRPIVFVVGLLLHVATMFYLIFVIKDGSVRKTVTWKFKVLDFFSCDNFKENVKISMKKRENHGRAQLCLLAISSSILILNFTSVYDIMYLFTKKMYGWTLSDYSLATTVSTIATIVSLTLAISLLIRVWKVRDSWLGFIGTVSFLSDNVIKAFAYKPWIYYVSLASGLLGGIAPFAVRARLSKLVADDELGKVFAFVSALENVAPIIGTVLFVSVYNASISFFPGLVFLVSAATLTFPQAVFIWLVRVPFKNYKDLEKQNQEETNASP